MFVTTMDGIQRMQLFVLDLITNNGSPNFVKIRSGRKKH
jgi:hypothetical protein